MHKEDVAVIRIIIIIIAIPALLYGLVMLGCASLYKFKVYNDSSYEEKARSANSALMPQVAEYVERHGLRGFQDVDCQVETRLFDNIDDLTAAIPSLECYKTSTTKSGNDVKGKKVTVYEIDSVRPCEGRTSVLPLDFSLVKADSQENYWTWDYSIYEYKDGSCRFVILIRPM